MPDTGATSTTVKSGLTNSPFIGVEGLHVAKMLTDAEGGAATYETPISMPWLNEVQIKPASSQEKLYGDNMAVATATTMSDIALTVTADGLPLEYKAYLFGHKFDAGKIVVNKDDVAPYFAVMFASTKANGKKRFVKFYKVQFAEPDETSKTKEEKVSFSTMQYSGTAIYRTCDGNIYTQADEESEGYTEATGTDWFTKVD